MWKKKTKYSTIEQHNQIPQDKKKIKIFKIEINFNNFNKTWSTINILNYLSKIEKNDYTLENLASLDISHLDLQDLTIPQLLIDHHQALNQKLGIILFPVFNSQSISYILDPLNVGTPISLWFSENKNSSQDNFYEFIKDNKKTTYIIYTSLNSIPQNVEHFTLNAIKFFFMNQVLGKLL